MRKPTNRRKDQSRKSIRSSPAKPSSSKTPSRQSQGRVSTPAKTVNSSNVKQDVSRRTRRFKQGTRALKEIRALQRTTDLLIPKASFCRVVKEVINQFAYNHLRIQSTALQALQEAAEMYMVQFFEDSYLCSLHAKRVTLMIVDCELMRRLRGPGEIVNK